MEHVADDLLALAALGEPLTDDALAHLERCATCREEAAAFEAVVTVGRSVTPEDHPSAPPAHVWEGILAEIAGDETAAGPPGATIPDPGRSTPDDATVVPLAPARRRGARAGWFLAAAAGLVVGGVGGVVVADRLGTEPAPTVLAEVALAGLPEWRDSSGVARIEKDAAGARTLVVNLAGRTFDDGFQEVWLIDRDVTRLVSLGVIEGTEGRLPIPASVDLDVYAVVDVSAEPLDGDPAHSGDSIVRGVLGA